MSKKRVTKVTPKKRKPASVPAVKANTAEFDATWHPRFLELLGTTCNVTLSAHGAGIDRRTAYRHYKSLPEFAAAWDDAKEAAVEILEGEAWSRARKMSDVLMIFLLKAHKPERYREQYAIVGPGGGAIQIDINREIAKIYGDVEEQTDSAD